MLRITVDIDCLKRGRRTGILARPAPDADFLVDLGDEQLTIWNHVHRLGRTVFRARSTIGFLGLDDAILLFKLCLANLKKVLLLHRDRNNSSGRTNFAAKGTVKFA